MIIDLNDIDYMQICVCSNLRKTSRVVTQLYDKLLQPTGLKITQYSMLVNIKRNKDISISKLGEVMLLDQTTVTRNVNILRNNGYVNIIKDHQDSRTKIITLTDLGIEKLKEATYIWSQIQERIVNDIGKETYKNFLETQKIIQKSIELYE
ncbi:MarR family winged helix-turn-helix transcriptional regulator [Bacillus sp. NEB1478]|uniref:MarR family winged helix-turn-helix transcriptional regulator n=1 Tax=Bacillus sp. NEB1478 TaxID=3073816 RepID=UPI0028739337|nr:MarR family winged helix-turn-helix transcriptional regulator [Bacillus sp. NEB1478]WNB90917.1 MarR family winged helix-turn-helix transcriptional regulator [Bacillus sp. NEB1478]